MLRIVYLRNNRRLDLFAIKIAMLLFSQGERKCQKFLRPIGLTS